MAFKEIAQPKTRDERVALARRTCEELSLTGTMLIDDMDDQSRALFGDLPSPAIIIGPDGHVQVKLPWAEPAVVGPRLKKALAQTATTIAKPDSSVQWQLLKGLHALHAGNTDRARRTLDAFLARVTEPRWRAQALRARYRCAIASKAPAKAIEKHHLRAKEAAEKAFKNTGRRAAALASLDAIRP